MGVLLFFGAVMASLAGTTLVWRGTALDRAWRLNPRAYRTLAPHGRLVGIAFFVFAAALVLAGIGWLRRRVWGWRLAVAIIAIQVLGNVLSLIEGDLIRGFAGFLIAASLLWYLLLPRVRAHFETDKTSDN